MKCIVAVDKNYAIGSDNDLLFKLKGDLEFFKQTTKDQAVIMGDRTLLSLPETASGKILPGRNKLVLTQNKEVITYYAKHEDIFFINSISSKILSLHKDSFVIGGGYTYKQFAPFITEMYITHIDAEGENPEVFFPEDLRPDDSWESEEIMSKTENKIKYRIMKYTRPELPRITQELTLDGWIDIAIKDIKPGNIFRMFEADKITPVIGDHGRNLYKATSEPFEQDGRWGISCEPCELNLRFK